MTKRAPLDALIRRVSRMAEQMFDRHGDIDPIWLVETASGEQHTIVSPIIAPSPLAAAAEKDRIAAEMRNYFAENDVVRYACAKEAWTLADPERKQMPTTEQAALEFAAMGYTLANHPERREVVTIDAERSTNTRRNISSASRSRSRDRARSHCGRLHSARRRLAAHARADRAHARGRVLSPDHRAAERRCA